MVPAAGDIFAERFLVDTQIGAGGFAAVYRAIDRRTGRLVALKVLEHGPNGYTREARRRFAREARVLRELDHPNVVRLVDYGSEDTLYLAFELVDGMDLAELLAAGPLEVNEAAEILDQLLAGLGAAHDAGVLHRDVKPENIRVVGEGAELEVKLLDFGIARSTDGGAPITKTGELIGTPRYMSPEQLTEQPLTPASDLYSAGVVGLEMLLGRDAMHGNRWIDQLDRLRSGYVFAVPDIERHRELMVVLGKMTSLEPHRRYATAHAARRALVRDEVARTTQVVPRGAQHWRWLLVGVLVLGAVLIATMTTDDPSEGISRREQTRDITALTEVAPPPTLPPSPNTADMPTPQTANDTTGCGLEPLSPNGLPMHLPARYDRDRAYPMVVMLRDRHMIAATWLEQSGFRELADEHGFVLIAPNPLDLVNPWFADFEAERIAIRVAVRRAMAAACIDPGRIFMAGHGHGSTIAKFMSCQGWVAGLAAYAPRASHPPPCKWFDTPYLALFPSRSRHQRVSDDTPPDRQCERPPMPTFSDYRRTWRTALRLDGTDPAVWNLPGAECERYDSDRLFVSCVHDGGRNWPGVPRERLAPPAVIEALGHEPSACDGTLDFEFRPAPVMWSFFASLEPRDPERVVRALHQSRDETSLRGEQPIAD